MAGKFIALFIFAAAVLAAATGQYWVRQADYYFGQTPVPATSFNIAANIAADRLVIPRLGIAAPIVYAEEESERVFQEALQKGVVHYPGAARIGERGNAYIFGHSSDYVWAKGDYKSVFALLPEIKAGDEIFASDKGGAVFAYRVIETKIASPDDLSVLGDFGGERKLLTLQTSYPLGTALRRFIVLAELIAK